jgi:AraC-like DNA-binding protein
MKQFYLSDHPAHPAFPLIAGIARIESGGFPVHSHDFHELVIVMEGRGIHRVFGHPTALEPGVCFVIPEDAQHGFAQCRNLVLANIGFRRDLVHATGLDAVAGITAFLDIEPKLRISGTELPTLNLSQAQITRAVAIVDEIIKENDRGETGREIIRKNLFMNLLIFLARLYTAEGHPTGHAFSRLARAAKIIEETADRPFDADAVAGEIGYSISGFRKAFRRVFGLTPLQYSTQVRMARARDLLLARDRSITEIAGALGYDDPNYFTRLFRLHSGQSPRDFRKSAGKR